MLVFRMQDYTFLLQKLQYFYLPKAKIIIHNKKDHIFIKALLYDPFFLPESSTDIPIGRLLQE